MLTALFMIWYDNQISNLDFIEMNTILLYILIDRNEINRIKASFR